MPPKTPKTPKGKGRDKGKKEATTPKETPRTDEAEVAGTDVETSGFGRFEYSNGTIYVGNWQLFGTVKKRQGFGKLIHTTTSSDVFHETYEGNWVEDKMNGYGVFNYSSGAIYSGEWKDDKHSGKGRYEFPDGSLYDGEWNNHMMNGEGLYTDPDGVKWKGIFVNGTYESKDQHRLQSEKALKLRIAQLEAEARPFPKRFTDTWSASDKKTYKENLSVFFITLADLEQFLKDLTLPKYEDRTHDKWNDAFNFLQGEETSVFAVPKASKSTFVPETSIISEQLVGTGQLIEFKRISDTRQVELGICQTSEDTYNVIHFYDGALR